MSKNFFDVAHAHSKASNKNSAMAVSGGLSYSPSKDGYQDFDTPPPYFAEHELQGVFAQLAGFYGFKSFRLTVLGVAKDQQSEKLNAMLVCRCSCGMFTLKPAKKVRRGSGLSCGVCSKNFQRRANERYGGNPSVSESAEIWQRMGGA